MITYPATTTAEENETLEALYALYTLPATRLLRQALKNGRPRSTPTHLNVDFNPEKDTVRFYGAGTDTGTITIDQLVHIVHYIKGVEASE